MSCCMHREKHFYFKMLITFEPNVAQGSVASQNDHKSKACLPEASITVFTMYSRLKRRLRRLYKAPFLATFFLAPHSSSQDLKENIRFVYLGSCRKKDNCPRDNQATQPSHPENIGIRTGGTSWSKKGGNQIS